MKVFLSIIFVLSVTISAVSYGQDYAMQFDGVDDFIEVPHHSSFVWSQEMTIEVWLRFYGTDSVTNIFSKIVSSEEDKHLFLQDDFAEGYLFRDATGPVVRSLHPLALDTWYHVAFTSNADSLFLYVNGIRSASAATVGSQIRNSNAPVHIGAKELGLAYPQPIDGEIDDLRIWSVFKTAQEIREMMFLEASGTEPGLVAAWSFNEGQGQVAHDVSPNGNHGTLGGTANTEPEDPIWVQSTTQISGDVLIYSTSDDLDWYTADWYDNTIPSILHDHGYDVFVADRRSVPTLTDDLLSSFSQLWIMCTDTSVYSVLTPAEVSAIHQYHYGGNGLLIMADHSPPFVDDANAIASPLGVTFEGLINHGNDSDPIYPDFDQHPLFVNVSAFVGHESEPVITAVSPSEVVASYNGDAIIAVLDDTYGRVVFDVTFTRGWDGHAVQYDNPQYFRNITHWLMGDLVAYWSFDDGMATDQSGYGNDGTIYGAIPVEGVSGQALSFDGVDDWVEIPDHASLRPAHLTLSAWVYFHDYASEHMTLIGKSVYSNATNEQYSLALFSDQVGGFSVKRNSDCLPLEGWYGAGSQPTIVADRWYFMAGTWDGTSVRLYIDGILVNQNDAVPPGSIDNCAGGAFRMGVWWASFPQWFHGTMDEVRVYDRALTEPEVLALYEQDAPLTGLISGIVRELPESSPIEGAVVRAWQEDMVIGEDVSNSQGLFALANLPVGNYDSVGATCPGYEPSTYYQVYVVEDETTVLPFDLAVSELAALEAKVVELNDAIKVYILAVKTGAADMEGECHHIFQQNETDGLSGLFEEIFTTSMDEGPSEVASIIVNMYNGAPAQIIAETALFFTWEVLKYLLSDGQNQFRQDLDEGALDGYTESSEFASYFQSLFNNLEIPISDTWHPEFNQIEAELEGNLNDFMSGVGNQPIPDELQFRYLIEEVDDLITAASIATAAIEVRNSTTRQVVWQIPGQCDFALEQSYEFGMVSTQLEAWNALKTNYNINDEVQETLTGVCDFDIPEERKLGVVVGWIPLIGEPAEDVLNFTYKTAWKTAAGIPCFGQEILTQGVSMTNYAKVIQFANLGLCSWQDDVAMAYNLQSKVLDDIAELILHPESFSCLNDVQVTAFAIEDVCIEPPQTIGTATANVSIFNYSAEQTAEVFFRVGVMSSLFWMGGSPFVSVESGPHSITPLSEAILNVEIPVAPLELFGFIPMPYFALVSVHPSWACASKTTWFAAHQSSWCDAFAEDESQPVFSAWLHTGEQASQSMAVAPDVRSLIVSLNYPGSDVDLHIYDEMDRHVGIDYETSELDLGIPGAEFLDDSSTFVAVYLPDVGGQNLTIMAYGKMVTDSEFVDVAQYLIKDHPATLGVVETAVYRGGLPGDSVDFTFTLREVGGHHAVTAITANPQSLENTVGHQILDSCVAFQLPATELEPGGIMIIPGVIAVPDSVQVGVYTGVITLSSSAGGFDVPLTLEVVFICGDINGSGLSIDIADLVYLVDYMFNGGPEPPVMQVADVDGSGGIDISDLVYLVDYMFNGGPEPVCGS